MVMDAHTRDERRKRLTMYLLNLQEHIEKLNKWALRDGITGYFAQMCTHEAGQDIDKVRKELQNIKLSVTDIKGQVTEDMIQQAREVNIETVVEFTRGKANAFCHEDNNPSLYHAKRVNKACCPVCNRYFDAIEVLIERDGLPFFTAVKQLIGDIN
jgi:hypothetical protein